MLRANSGLARGFERYDDELPVVEATRKWPERIAAATTDAALRALDGEFDGPCLLWVHFQDPHGPYTPPDGLRERYLERERERPDGRRRLRIGGPGGIPGYQVLRGEREVAFYRAGYDAEVAYVDEQLGRLLEGLRTRALLDRSLVVFTADHGESLGEHDYWFAHGELLTEEQVRVPLIVHLPGLPPGRRQDLASLVDLWPTLAERLLSGAPPGPVSGRSLLSEGAESADSELYLATLSGSLTPRFGLIDPEFNMTVRWTIDGDGALRSFSMQAHEGVLLTTYLEEMHTFTPLADPGPIVVPSLLTALNLNEIGFPDDLELPG